MKTVAICRTCGTIHVDPDAYEIEDLKEALEFFAHPFRFQKIVTFSPTCACGAQVEK